MRLFKLALRTVLVWRGSLYAAVAAVAVVAAIATIAGSVVSPLTTAVRLAFRTSISGELAGRLHPDEIAELERRTDALDVAISVTRHEPGVLETSAGLLTVDVVHTRLANELEYAILDLLLPATPAAEAAPDTELAPGEDQAPGQARDASLTSGDALLRADGSEAAELAGSVVRLSLPEGGRLVRILDVAPAGPAGPRLLVNVPAAGADASGGATREVRLRGIGGPLAEARAEVTELGLQPTGWTDEARRVLRPLRDGVGLLLGILTLLAAATLIPGNLLIARRARPSLELLSAWGFAPAAKRRVVLFIGATGAGLAAAAGAAVGLAATAVMNARLRPAVSLLPLDVARTLEPFLADASVRLSELATAPEPGPTALDAGPAVLAAAGVVTPSVGWALVAVGTATLLGVLAALPSAMNSATLGPRRGLWHW